MSSKKSRFTPAPMQKAAIKVPKPISRAMIGAALGAGKSYLNHGEVDGKSMLQNSLGWGAFAGLSPTYKPILRGAGSQASRIISKGMGAKGLPNWYKGRGSTILKGPLQTLFARRAKGFGPKVPLWGDKRLDALGASLATYGLPAWFTGSSIAEGAKELYANHKEQQRIKAIPKTFFEALFPTEAKRQATEKAINSKKRDTTTTMKKQQSFSGRPQLARPQYRVSFAKWAQANDVLGGKSPEELRALIDRKQPTPPILTPAERAAIQLATQKRAPAGPNDPIKGPAQATTSAYPAATPPPTGKFYLPSEPQYSEGADGYPIYTNDLARDLQGGWLRQARGIARVAGRAGYDALANAWSEDPDAASKARNDRRAEAWAKKRKTDIEAGAATSADAAGATKELLATEAAQLKNAPGYKPPTPTPTTPTTPTTALAAVEPPPAPGTIYGDAHAEVGKNRPQAGVPGQPGVAQPQAGVPSTQAPSSYSTPFNTSPYKPTAVRDPNDPSGQRMTKWIPPAQGTGVFTGSGTPWQPQMQAPRARLTGTPYAAQEADNLAKQRALYTANPGLVNKLPVAAQHGTAMVNRGQGMVPYVPRQQPQVSSPIQQRVLNPSTGKYQNQGAQAQHGTVRPQPGVQQPPRDYKAEYNDYRQNARAGDEKRLADTFASNRQADIADGLKPAANMAEVERRSDGFSAKHASARGRFATLTDTIESNFHTRHG